MISGSGCSSPSSSSQNMTIDERLKRLYPMVNEEETPLPRCWSTKDKYNYTGLSMNNLRVHYKGHGKTHKDASSVRATHPIPASCGIYYFEVKIISKGRDGFMGIGLTGQGVDMNRLPGWDKHSYGYHGDDGHAFCASNSGQAYGPTFTTDDVIGCGVNLVDSTCFYTLNSHNLGIAFTDLPFNLYPTVGLQTPGEVVYANFGQEQFLFDIEGEMCDLRRKFHLAVERYPFPGKHGEWQTSLHHMVSTYLVHHGYSDTAEAFARSTNQEISLEITSMRNRQTIQKLVLQGHIGDAIAMTEKLYPGLLQLNQDLHFMLKCRQFVEIVGGSDRVKIVDSPDSERSPSPPGAEGGDESSTNDGATNGREENGVNAESDSPSTRGVEGDDGEASMDVDPPGRSSILSHPRKLRCLIRFGRELKRELSEMEASGSSAKNEANAKMLEEAFSLLAYADPKSGPVGWQLEPERREPICAALNSAILESRQLPGRPPLEIALSHAKQLLKLMSHAGLGACAFADVDSFLK